MALVFLHHVVGDLTVGKPELAEFSEAETVEAAIRAIGDCAEGAISVWRRRAPQQQQQARLQLAAEPRAARFVGMLNSLDVVAFLARSVGDHEKAMRTPVSDVVTPNPSLLKEVDPGTSITFPESQKMLVMERLIDALEMMKQGVRRLLVRKSVAWKGAASGSGPPSSSSLPDDKFCLLSREDVVRFLIGCLGALAPLPLSSISSLGAITPHYAHIEASSPALEAVRKISQDPCAIAVVETNADSTHKIVGDISAYKLWKCDYLAAAWAMANLSAGQFVIGADDNATTPISLPDFIINSPVDDAGASSRPRKFSSRSIGFFSNQENQMAVGRLRSMYRGRSAPLTCKHTSSLAAVMAQMLSHRATYVWVTDAESEDIMVGVVSYFDILHAVTKSPTSVVPPGP